MKMTLFFVSAVLGVLQMSAANIEQVIVRQQWPWSTDVKVEYKLSAVTEPVDLSVKAYNGEVELDASRLADAISGQLLGIDKDGVGTFIIDPVKAFGTTEVALANFSVKLSVSESKLFSKERPYGEPLYKIFDLLSGEVTDVTRGALLTGEWGPVETNFTAIGEGYTTSLDDVVIWTGVTNEPSFKTTKMVLRKIPAKGVKNYLIGSRETQKYQHSNAALRSVNFTNDYYMGVFQVTFAQFQTILTNATTAIDTNRESSQLIDYTNGVANSGMYYTNALYSATRPVNIDWLSLRGTPAKPESHTVSSKKWFGLMRHRFSGTFATPVFDLPSECVWEYACRAGTETDFNDGLASPTMTTAKKLGRFEAYSADRNQDLSKGTMTVGQYRPNAWGLYDMHGNGQELCWDGYKADVSSYGGDDPVISPLDADSKNNIVARSRPANEVQISRGGTSYRGQVAYSIGSRQLHVSFRVCLTIYE